MASQVLSGTSNPSYTNNTGQNVRVVINYMLGAPLISQTIAVRPGPGGNIPTQVTQIVERSITLNWAGVSVSATSYAETQTTFSTERSDDGFAIGRNLAYSVRAGNIVSNNCRALQTVALPLELILAPGQTFSAICNVYNIVVIPEAG